MSKTNFEEFVTGIIKGENSPVRSTALLVRIPKEGLTDANLDITKQVIESYFSDLAVHLIMIGCMQNIDCEIKGSNVILKESNKESINVTTDFSFGTNIKMLRNTGFASLTLRELIFDDKNDYKLSVSDYSLKEQGNEKFITDITDIDKFYLQKLKLGDVTKKSVDELLDLFNGEKLKKQIKDYDTNDHLTYLIQSELANRARQANDLITINCNYLASLLDDDDLHFTTELIPFAHDGKSYIINKIVGQGEILYRLKELNSAVSKVNLPEISNENFTV